MPSIRCPGCKTRYKVPESAAGRRTRCRKCGQVFLVPEFKEPEPEEELRLTDLESLAGGEAVETPRPPQPAVAAGVPPAVSEAKPAEAAVGYAPDEAAVQQPTGTAAYAAYFRSIAKSLAFPLRTGDLIMFIIVWVILLIGGVVGAVGGCLGLIGSLIVYGWYLSFQLNTVGGAAAGDEDLPRLTLTGGWWDDIFAPFLKMLCTYVLAFIPVLIFSLAYGILGGLAAGFGLAGSGGTVAGLPMQALLGTVACGLIGFFVWPMLVLVVACGDFGGFLRPDLMFKTIIKSFPAYLITVGAVYLALGLTIVSSALVESIKPDLNDIPQWLMVVIGLPALTTLLELYLTIIAMRAIGFYYHHFKHRFAWSWG